MFLFFFHAKNKNEARKHDGEARHKYTRIPSIFYVSYRIVGAYFTERTTMSLR